jgi:MFS transporter, DHA1 family, multidrug resistance protein
VTEASLETTNPPLVTSDVNPGAYMRISLAIGSGAFLASFAMNFWWPFLPLYLQDIGATSDANALFWVGVATTVQGVARLVTGPFWGVLSDRYGRKVMFIRALYAATITTAIAAIAHAPWVIVVSLTMQGLFSGFIPAAIALTSVSVPEHRLERALGIVTAGQYLGGTLGPFAGGLLAWGFGFRGAIVASAILPAVAATWIVFAVPRDSVAPRLAQAAREGRHRLRPQLGIDWARGFSRIFWVAVFLYFGLFALNQLIRVATPIAIKDIAGEDRAGFLSSIAFGFAGAGSVAGVLLLARALGMKTGLRGTLVILTVLSAAAMPLMAAGGNEWLVIGGLAAFAVANGASMPATNALIASTVEPARRGTAFGLASSAQAIAFMVGPMSAAFFASTSLAAGFLVCGALFLAFAVVVGLFAKAPEPLREPV